MINNYRFELNFKNIKQLEDKLNFCKINNINKINIPCKGLIKKEFFNEAIEYINKNYYDFDVVYHYSLYHQYKKNRIVSYQYFLDFITKFIINRNNNILLVSGSNKKKDFDVVQVLSDLQNEGVFNSSVGVAYNPYLLKYYNSVGERERYEKKLSTGLINSIWLQYGTDINLLEQEIKFLKNINREFKIPLFGSLLIPSKQFVARFKFRPWKEVYISRKYLSSIENFQLFTTDLINFYLDNNICPVVETESTTSKSLNFLYGLLNN
tara:strand:+ start:140 stop:937 length:798 start_codon:yes stop_codon:yes gene_type:complete